MRTTVTLADDVAAGVEKVRRERDLGLSEAVNDLIRAGLAERGDRRPIDFPAYDMGPAKIDVSNIGEAIEAIERADGSFPSPP
jgi:hypothetical protein